MLGKGWPLCYEFMVRYLVKFGNFYHYEAYIESQAIMDGLNSVSDTVMPHGRNNSKLWNFTKKYQQPRDREKHSNNITSKCWLNRGIPKGKASLKATYP